MIKEFTEVEYQEKIFARWFLSENWGDALNPILIKKLSGLEPIWCDYPQYIYFLNSFFAKWRVIENHQDLFNPITMNLLSVVDHIQQYLASNLLGWDKKQKIFSQDIYLVVGSILHQTNRNSIIWGSGFLSETYRMREKPRKICAVRGPLTREIILNQGINCPEIYGDPALLYPVFYTPPEKKIYKLGLIPHYREQDLPLLTKLRNYPDVKIISITGGIEKVVDDVCSCEYIASSSLHGLIIADAYGIPSTWIKLSDNLIGKGFKFRDYFASVRRKEIPPLIINNDTTLQMIYDHYPNYRIDIDLDKLLSVCPFKTV